MEKTISDFSTGLFIWQLLLAGVGFLVLYIIYKLYKSSKLKR